MSASAEEEEMIRWDRCGVQAVQSLIIAPLVGLIASAVIFKRKQWPVLLGVGYGVGASLANCTYELYKNQQLPLCEDDKQKGKKDNKDNKDTKDNKKEVPRDNKKG